ncbi:hypothetical protein M222_2096 [Enterococcus faecalis AZ19]|uniref:hypothetical protein n=1 Tax=Enterococcus TaxID=1350 RepID=UPI0004598554|nr:hypothetical protein [Enterococcus faecalis]KAJ72896.1 hypothetical protein M222_2096 [Enterococcus faecalis AZ19]
MIKFMDKLTIIRLLECGRSKRSVAKELGLNRKTVGAISSSATGNRKPRKYTHEIDQRVEEILAFDQLKAKQLVPHKQQLTTVDKKFKQKKKRISNNCIL